MSWRCGISSARPRKRLRSKPRGIGSGHRRGPPFSRHAGPVRGLRIPDIRRQGHGRKGPEACPHNAEFRRAGAPERETCRRIHDGERGRGRQAQGGQGDAGARPVRGFRRRGDAGNMGSGPVMHREVVAGEIPCLLVCGRGFSARGILGSPTGHSEIFLRRSEGDRPAARDARAGVLAPQGRRPSRGDRGRGRREISGAKAAGMDRQDIARSGAGGSRAATSAEIFQPERRHASLREGGGGEGSCEYRERGEGEPEYHAEQRGVRDIRIGEGWRGSGKHTRRHRTSGGKHRASEG